MTIIIISLVLLASLLPHLTFTARVNEGIVNGNKTTPHSRPYMVSLQENHKHLCGGFLISDEFVLTAAHCRMKKEILTVVVGAHDLNKKNEGSIHIVKSYHKHPKFSLKRNDIMLLRLEKKVKPGKNVAWISLPGKGKSINNIHPNCSVAGWGSLKTNGPTSNLLMEAYVTILKSATCKEKWTKKEFSVSKMMCAYGRGGSCSGDSGGPLVCGGIAVGVTSFGDKHRCNSPKHPEVYTKISAYLQWIKKVIKNVK